eukprot:s989_g17.t3
MLRLVTKAQISHCVGISRLMPRWASGRLLRLPQPPSRMLSRLLPLEFRRLFQCLGPRTASGMSSLRLRMNSLGINVVQNGPNMCMVETAWYAMTKAERMFLEKHVECKLTANAKENVVHDLVNVYDWIMLPASVGEKFFRNGTIELSKFPRHQLNGSFCALSAMRKTVQWYCQGCFDENADYEGVVFVVRRRSKNEAQRKWVAASNVENYF